MTEVMGFPPRGGFGPHSTTVTGGLHAQCSARGDCSVSSGVLSPGFIRQGVGVWKRTFAAARRRGDRLAYTTLIQRVLPALHRHRTWQERRGVIRSAVRSRPTAFARPQVLRAHQNGVAVLGTAPTPGPVWSRCSTMTHALNHSKRTDSKPPTGQSAVAESASDALHPTAKAVGFRAVRL